MFKVRNAQLSAQTSRFEHSIFKSLSIVSEFGFRISSFIRHLVIALSILLVAACHKTTVHNAVDPNGPVEVVIPERGAYTGAFIDFGDEEDTVNLEEIEEFERMVGKHQAIIASSSYWGEQSFPTANLNVLWRHGSLPLVFWSPWDKPYVQNRGPDKF